MSLARQIRHSHETREVITLKVKGAELDQYPCVVMGVRKSFVIVREIYYLTIGGIAIFPKRAIAGYKSGGFERCASEIIRENGSIKKLELPLWLDQCQTLTDVLASLKALDLWPVVETKDDDVPLLYLGPIVEVYSDHFFLQCYDADGTWEQVYGLRLNKIIRIEFGDNYSTVFNRHMRAHQEAERRVMLEHWQKQGEKYY